MAPLHPSAVPADEPTAAAAVVAANDRPKAASAPAPSKPTTPVPSITELLLAEATPTLTGQPTGSIVTERAQARIRQGYALAQRGAYFAARSEFIAALRILAEAKDRMQDDARCSIALADGLRAIDEAADFSPRRSGEVEINVPVIVTSHRTPVAKTPHAAGLQPPQLADLYLRYAQLRLGAAAAGEPAGSMALHALGKTQIQLAALEAEKYPIADRQAFAMQLAALLARSDNTHAAHELGVLLAESGHFTEAERLLGQVAVREPDPVVLRNLARVQRKSGRKEQAAESQRQAELLASRGYGGTSSVAWMRPEDFARSGRGNMAAGPRVATQPVAAPTMQYTR